MFECDTQPRQQNFTCDCCFGPWSANFCIGAFALYGLSTILLVTVMIYWYYLNTISGIFESRHTANYFFAILTLQILEMFFRMGYFSMGIQYFLAGNKNAVTYREEQWVSTMPFLFKTLIILVLQQFKVELSYIEKKKSVPAKVNWFFSMLYVFDCFIIFSTPFILCADIPNLQSFLIEMSIETLYLVPLSIVSLALLLKLKRQFTFGHLRQVIKRFYVLEVMIQVLIWGRLVFTSSFQSVIRASSHETKVSITYLSIYFVFTELVPLMLMLWAMKIQINNARGALYEKSERSNSLTKSDGFSSFIGSENTDKDHNSLTFNAELSQPLQKVKGKETRSFLIPGQTIVQINSPRRMNNISYSHETKNTWSRDTYMEKADELEQMIRVQEFGEEKISDSINKSNSRLSESTENLRRSE